MKVTQGRRSYKAPINAGQLSIPRMTGCLHFTHRETFCHRPRRISELFDCERRRYHETKLTVVGQAAGDGDSASSAKLRN